MPYSKNRLARWGHSSGCQSHVAAYGISGNAHIRVIVSALTVLDAPRAEARTPQVLSISPPRLTRVTLPADRPNVAVLGSDSVDVYRQVTPNVGSLIDHCAPIMSTVRLDMLGRLPVKVSYCTCQGNVASRTVALPVEQAPTLALVM